MGLEDSHVAVMSEGAQGSSLGGSPAAGAHRIALQRVAVGMRGNDAPLAPLGLLSAATGIREHRGLWRTAPPRLQLADDAVAASTHRPQLGDATAQTLAFEPEAVVLSPETGATPGARREGRRTMEEGPWLDRLSDVGKRVGDVRGGRPVRVLWIDEVSGAAASLLQDGAADVVVRGEADETLPSVMGQAMAGRTDWRGERGVSWLDAGKVRHERESATPMRLPTPAWDLIDLESYSEPSRASWVSSPWLNSRWLNSPWLNSPWLASIQKRLRLSHRGPRGQRGPEATIYTTRSCPTDCPTCHGSFGSHGRERPVGEIIQEIRALVQKHRVRRLHIGDAAFDGNPGRAEAIASAIAKLRSAPGFGYLSLSFPRGLRGDGLTPSLIETLIRAGATTLPLRVTTASPRLQRLLKENIDLARVDAALVDIADRGARGHLLMRLGLPTETVGEVAHTIRWARASLAATADFENGRNVDFGPAWTRDQPGDIDDFAGLRRRALTSFYSSPTRVGRLAKSLPGSMTSVLQRRT